MGWGGPELCGSLKQKYKRTQLHLGTTMVDLEAPLDQCLDQVSPNPWLYHLYSPQWADLLSTIFPCIHTRGPHDSGAATCTQRRGRSLQTHIHGAPAHLPVQLCVVAHSGVPIAAAGLTYRAGSCRLLPFLAHSTLCLQQLANHGVIDRESPYLSPDLCAFLDHAYPMLHHQLAITRRSLPCLLTCT